MSREHLLPKCLYRRAGTILLANVAGEIEKVVSSEPTIRDVCGACNGGPLSKLDEYVCELYDRYFQTIVRSGECIKFSYDFDLLLRWLLKIGYNTARARRSWPPDPFTELREYVLGRQGRPPGVRVLLQLIIPTKVERGTMKDDPTATEVLPHFNRVAALDVVQLPGFTLAFLLSLYSYHFYVLIEDSGKPARERQRIFRELLREVPGAYELCDKNRAVVYASSVDWVTEAKRSGPLLRNLELGKKWQEEARKRKGR